MGLLKDFRDFAMKGNVVDLAVGVIIGAAFGGLTNSMVQDVLMPPIGKLVGNLDFTNLYISLSDKVDAANTQTRAAIAATQPAMSDAIASTQPTAVAALNKVTSLFDTTTRLPLAKARELGPVIAYGNFLTLLINFLIVAFVVFLIIKAMSVAQKRFDREKAVEAAAPPVPPADVILLTEIRDLLKQR